MVLEVPLAPEVVGALVEAVRQQVKHLLAGAVWLQVSLQRPGIEDSLAVGPERIAEIILYSGIIVTPRNSLVQFSGTKTKTCTTDHLVSDGLVLW